MVTRYFGLNGKVTAQHTGAVDDPYFNFLALTLTEYSAAQLVPTLSDNRAFMWRRIRDHREWLAQTGGVYVAPHWFHSDNASRHLYTIRLMKAWIDGLPDNTVLVAAWKTMSGAFTPMTVGLLKQILDAGAVNEEAIYRNAELHRAAMEALPDPLGYVDYLTVGWPAKYVR